MTKKHTTKFSHYGKVDPSINKPINLVKHRNIWLVCFAITMISLFTSMVWYSWIMLFACMVYSAFIASYPCSTCNQPIGSKVIKYGAFISFPTGKCRHCGTQYW